MRVLVVDDYEDTRRLYAEALREAGIEVHEAHEGELAGELARQVQPDVILMDMSMPGLDGWDATRAVRALALEVQPYIIAVTAAHGPESRRLAFEAGCDAFIAKPCSPDVVLAAVRAASDHDEGQGS